LEQSFLFFFTVAFLDNSNIFYVSLQINGQCSCFQNIELLKSRPAHLAVLLHHVVSQFDPAALVRCSGIVSLPQIASLNQSVSGISVFLWSIVSDMAGLARREMWIVCRHESISFK